MNHDDILSSIWEALHAATTHRTGFTLGSLATVTPDGPPRVRSVILRDFRANPQRLYVATHSHSAKVAEILANSQVAVTFYDEERAVQLRAHGTGSIIEHEAARLRAWHALAPHTQQQYAALDAPGSPLHEASRTSEDPASAFQRFAWLRIELSHLDWLNLATAPHQRWQFDRVRNTWRGGRVVP